MRPSERIEELVKQFCDAKKASIATTAEMDGKVLADTLSAYEKTKGQSAKRGPNARRIVMGRRTIRLATAAVVIIGVLAGLHFFGGPHVASVAWGELADRVGRIQTCIFRGYAKTIIDANSKEVEAGIKKVTEMETEAFVSSEYGTRSDMYADGKLQMSQYMLPEQKVMISVMPKEEKYMRINLTDELIEQMRRKGSDPREMVRHFMSGKYTELGRSTINGIEVEGIETKDPNSFGGQFEGLVWRLWVDVKTQLPVQMEMEMEMSIGGKSMSMQTFMVMDDFQWDVEIGPEVFEPNIPAHYTLLAEMQMPGQDEGSAVEGLRLFAEITGGKYPSSLSAIKITGELGKALGAEAAKALAPKVKADANSKPTHEERDAMVREMSQKSMKVMGATLFYAKLVQEGKDAAYYGDKVTASDANAVLLRWKISDGLYRVIFGNLATENVSAERLAELEGAQPQ